MKKKKKDNNQNNSQNYSAQQIPPYVPPQYQNGYPPQYQNGYPPQYQNGYPPQYQNGYPPQYQNGYPPQYQNGYPPQYQNGYYIPQQGNFNGGQQQFTNQNYTNPQPEPAAQAESSENRQKKQRHNKKSRKAKPPKTKGVKILISVVSLVLSISIVFGVLGIFGKLPFINYDSTGGYYTNTNAYGNASVEFNENVYIIKDLEAVQKKFKNISLEGNKYTLHYSKELPYELAGLNVGQLFCIPSDSSSKEVCFEMGFCGQVESIDEKSLTFVVPSTEQIFDSFSFHLEESNVNSAQFVPAEGVSVTSVAPSIRNSVNTLSATQFSTTPKISDSEKFKIGDYSISPKFSYKSPSSTPVREGYVMLCDLLELELKVESDAHSDDIKKEDTISGSITLEDLAAKMDIDWHKNSNDEIIVDEYDVGFATYEKIEFKIKDTLEIGNFKNEKKPYIQFKDVTDAEKGKFTLGSYVFGLDTGAIKTGISVEFFVSVSGEIEVSCELSTKGFIMAEVDSEDYSVTCKCYDYPSPILYDGEPVCQEHENADDCLISAKTKTELTLNARVATGIDISLNILGLTPIKLENNFIELEGTTHFEDEFDSNSEELNLLTDEDLIDIHKVFSTLKLSSNSTFKFYLGVKLTKPSPLKMDLFDFGYEKVLFDKVWQQIPEKIDFDHSECGFGNIYTNQHYTQGELDETFKKYIDDNDLNSIIADIKDNAGNAVIETLSDTLGIALDEFDISDDGKMQYYSLGAIYLLDENNKVTDAIITGKEIKNESGLCPGTDIDLVERIYSSPDSSDHIKFDVSYIVKEFLEQSGVSFDDLPNEIDLTIYTYESKDSNEKMMLLFSKESLVAIIVTD